MKQLKKLTRTQKGILSQHGLDGNEWGVVPEVPNKETFTVQHKVSKDIKKFDY